MLPMHLEHWNTILERTETPLRLRLSSENSTVEEAAELSLETRKIDLVVITGTSESISLSTVDGFPLTAVITKDPKNLLYRLRSTSLYLDTRDILVLSPSITPRTADALRWNRIMFIDQRGNAFFSRAGVYIDIRGKTQGPETPPGKEGPSAGNPKPPRAASLFTPRRAQISAFLLSNPELLNNSVRDIARDSGVSVGTAQQTLNLLSEAGYLQSSSPGRYRIKNLGGLLDAWAYAYPTGLGASQLLFQGTGQPDRLRDWKPAGWVSGEQAVPELVRGGRTTHLYVEDITTAKKIIGAARLKQDTRGEVLIRSRFWPSRVAHHVSRETEHFSWDKDSVFRRWPRAPRAVIYADLLSVDDPRLTEIAAHIKEEIIDGQR